jgi:hypothetical protein
MRSMPARSIPRGCIALAVILLAGCGADEPDTAKPANAPAPAAPTENEATEPETATRPLGDVQVTITRGADPGLEAVRRYTGMFYRGELEQLFENFSPEMRNEILPLAKLRELREFVREEYGEEVEVVGEDSQTRGDYRGFARWARFSKHEGLIEFQWILRSDDTVAGLLVRAARPKPSG